MEIIRDDICKNLVSIHYPGIVKNESRALETLGGIRNISSVYLAKNKKLELRMRPEDVCCKPACANIRPVTGIILKIKVRKKERKIISCQVVGHVTEEYRFTGLCDFQYIPTSKTESLYDKIVPRDFDVNWLKDENDAPLFLPPSIFSRTDTVQNFNFSKVSAEENRPNVIGRLKRKRFSCSKSATFENPEVPSGPKKNPSGSWLSAKIISKNTLDYLIQLFLQRPIYSKVAISCISKIPPDEIKRLLPCVAYFFSNGPWRSLWVRFGYDPRKDPTSRIYQTLDYRVKNFLSKDEDTKGTKKKRDFISNKSSRSVTVMARNASETSEKDKVELTDHIFRPGMIPPYRQCLYQYCDIHVPEIQSMIENLSPVEEQATCNEVHGWLPPGMSETCRDIMKKYVAEEVQRRNEGSLSSLDQTCPGRSRTCRSSGTESDSTDDQTA